MPRCAAIYCRNNVLAACKALGNYKPEALAHCRDRLRTIHDPWRVAKMRLLALAAAACSAHALAPAQTRRRAPLTATATGAAPTQTSRRALLTTTATGITTLVLSPATASAGSKLEDGLALPDGARQFNEFQGLKGEWTRFGERLKKTDIDDKEWEGVPLLLRRVYDAGDDMLFMAKGAFQRSYVQNISQGRHPLLATERVGRDNPKA